MSKSGNKSALLPSALSIESGSEVTNWKCHLCMSYFPSRKSLKMHLGEERRSNNSEDTNPYSKFPQQRLICKFCQKTFDTSQGLKQHIGKKHKEQKSSICGYCQKTFAHKYAVKFHVDQVHIKNTRVKCKYCTKTFYNVYVMKMHSKRCNKRFPSN